MLGWAKSKAVNITRAMVRQIGRTVGLQYPAWDDFWYGPTGGTTASGVDVTVEKAMQATAVFACIRVLSETIASLPIAIYERVGNRGDRKPVPTHPAHYLLHNEPNPEITSYAWRELMVSHLATRGNAYSYIDWGPNRFTLTALWPIHPSLIDPIRDDNYQLAYEIQGWRMPGETKSATTKRSYAPYKILHLMGLTDDGAFGISPIQAARETIGATLGAMDYGARLWANDARARQAIELEATMDRDDRKQFQIDWQNQFTGAGRHKVPILEPGMKLKNMQITPEDAQFLETRKFQIADIARIWRIPPHLIGELDRATFNNIEHLGIEFVVHTIRPWLRRLEELLNRGLLVSREEKERYFIEFNVDGLLRGDVKSRFDAYATARNWGWMSVNEIRRQENRNSIENGDEYMRPMNMEPLGTPPKVKERTEKIMEKVVENEMAARVPITIPEGENGNGSK